MNQKSIYRNADDAMHPKPRFKKPDELHFQHTKMGTLPEYYRELEKYEKELERCEKEKTPCAHPHTFEDGKEYEENVDYQKRWSNGFATWVGDKSNADKQICVQIVKEESQDFLFASLLMMTYDYKYLQPRELAEKLKSQFTIKRK